MCKTMFFQVVSTGCLSELLRTVRTADELGATYFQAITLKLSSDCRQIICLSHQIFTADCFTLF